MITLDNKIRLSKFDFNGYLQSGIDYKQYKEQMYEDYATNLNLKIKNYIILNSRRMHRIENTYNISEEIAERVRMLKYKTYWLVITEHWCGDASQSLPVFNKIAERSNGKIEMKLLYRDQNSELIDAYLSNNSRSIPKLIQLDKFFNVTGIWGPRPNAVQRMVKELRSNSDNTAAYSKELQLWYLNDNQRSLESEITKLLYKANLVCPDCFYKT
jgi:hypothetical protein